MFFANSWLQPDPAVNPEACELQLPADAMKASVCSEFLVIIKDQDYKPVYVEGMKV